jgi:protein quaking
MDGGRQQSGGTAIESLNDELHVLVQCEDTENRASLKVARAVAEVKKLLVPAVC